MGLSLQFIVVFFALAATFSLTYANHYHDGKRIEEVEIEGVVYCSSDGNRQSSSTRRLSRAQAILSCDDGVTYLYETRTKSDGEFEIEIEDQAKVDVILANVSGCSMFMPLPVDGCLLAGSNGYFECPLDPDVEYHGDHGHIKTLPCKRVSCL